MPVTDYETPTGVKAIEAILDELEKDGEARIDFWKMAPNAMDQVACHTVFKRCGFIMYQNEYGDPAPICAVTDKHMAMKLGYIIGRWSGVYQAWKGHDIDVGM